MKRVLLALLIVGAVGWAAIAQGPMFGIGLEPTAGAQASFSAGWAFDSWKIIGTKEAFSTWYGDWSVSALWTPDWGFADGRVGALLGWDWETGGLYFNDLAFVIGVQRFWDIVGIYGQFEVGTSTLLIPRVGVEFVFSLPQAAEAGQ